MLITIIIIIGLSFLVLLHEAGHFAFAKLFGLTVHEFSFGFGPRITGITKGGTAFNIRALPFGGFVKIAGENDEPGTESEKIIAVPESEKRRYFYFLPAWKKSVIVLAGIISNFLLGWLILSAVLMIGTPAVLVISGVADGSPAEVSGIREGDVITGFTKAKDFIAYVKDHKGREITLGIQREAEELQIRTTPRSVSPEGQGLLGVSLAEGGAAPMGFFGAMWEGLLSSAAMSWLTLVSFWMLIKALVLHASLMPGVVGPVGIFSIAQATGKMGFVYLFQLISLISINLAVINLIPFPALDGGRFFMILIEKLKGSPIPRKAEAWINGAGFAFLILLMLLITVRDVSKWF